MLDKVKKVIITIGDFFKEHLGWKILFVIYAFLVGGMSFGGLLSEYKVSELTLLLANLMTFVFIFVGGYFYSLAFNKRLFSLQASQIIFSFIISSSVIMYIFSFFTTVPQVMAQLKVLSGEDALDETIRTTAIIVTLLYYFVVYLILNLPVIIGYFHYKKRYATMDAVEKPYWKLILTYFAVFYLLDFLYLAIYTDKSQLIPVDYFYILSNIFDALLIVLFAYNIKLGKQIIWKVLLIPYILFTFSALFFGSEHFLEVSQINLVTMSFVSLVTMSIYTVLYFYIFYKYAFKEDVYKPVLTVQSK